jgi:hypothetical protein
MAGAFLFGGMSREVVDAAGIESTGSTKAWGAYGGVFVIERPGLSDATSGIHTLQPVVNSAKR